MEKKCNIKIFQKVQRMCCLGISGAMRTTPTRALETILYIQPIEIRVKYEAALTATRLQVMGEWISRDHKSYHQNIIGVLTGYAQSAEVSDRIPEMRLVANCETITPTRDSWLGGTLAQMPIGVCCYTDGSRLGERTGLGFFIEEPAADFYFRLPDHNTVLQAEVRAITECVNWLGNTTRPSDVNIFTDSQMTIRAITSERVKSRTILECKRAINDYSARGRLRIIWVPGHCGVVGNERANSLATKARELHAVNLENAKPFGTTKNELEQWAKLAHVTMWNEDTVGRTTKILWGDPNWDKTKSILELNKSEMSGMTSVLTGHSGLRAHLCRMGLVENDECRACGEDVETMEHYLCQCPAFARARSKYLLGDTIPDMTQLRGMDLNALRNFVQCTEFLKI